MKKLIKAIRNQIEIIMTLLLEMEFVLQKNITALEVGND